MAKKTNPELRDEIESLKFKIERSDKSLDTVRTVFGFLAPILLVLFFFEMGKDVKSLFYLVSFGFGLVASIFVVILSYFPINGRTEKQINKLYKKLIN